MMMNLTNSLLDHVAYLHDARCLEVIWDCSPSDERAIRMKVVVDPDAELPSWNGKTLLITFTNVFAARFTGWAIIGGECIDSWEQGVSDFLEQKCKVWSSRGAIIPSLKFSISFRSGSELEVICFDASAIVTD